MRLVIFFPYISQLYDRIHMCCCLLSLSELFACITLDLLNVIPVNKKKHTIKKVRNRHIIAPVYPLFTKFFCLVILCVDFSLSRAQITYPHIILQNEKAVNEYYKRRSYTCFWYGTDTADALRNLLIRIIADSCALQGLDKTKYLSRIPDTPAIHNALQTQSGSLEYDCIITDIAFSYLADLYGGKSISEMISSDELSPHYVSTDQEKLLKVLSEITTRDQLRSSIKKLEPVLTAYRLLKNELAKEVDSGKAIKINQLDKSLNNYRWITHFGFKKFIIVNIAAAELNYYENDSLILNMKIVAGKRSSRTPRFATWCNKIILYPYWYVPRSIALSEILPMWKKNEGYLKNLNIQIIDDAGKVINPYNFDRSAYSAKKFSYTFRQLPGENNSLGVIKFNLTSPYSIYMHDTNQKNAFNLSKRYISHGCIRLENPLALAEHLTKKYIDTTAFTYYINQQKTLEINLKEPVAVFILYMTVDMDNTGKIQYYPDVYNLDLVQD